jgi:hypothetical protein
MNGESAWQSLAELYNLVYVRTPASMNDLPDWAGLSPLAKHAEATGPPFWEGELRFSYLS